MIIETIIISYLIGSIPTAYLIVKLFNKKNILKNGNKNGGATNVYLVTKKKRLYLLTLIIDLFKGWLALYITTSFFNNLWQTTMISGLFVIIGHNYSLFLKFKGGKGLASFIGVLLFINLNIFLIFASIIILRGITKTYYDEFTESILQTIIISFITYLIIPEYLIHSILYRAPTIIKYSLNKPRD